MNVNRYVNQITKKIRCTSEKKVEIRKDLLTDINCRLEKGETLENVMAQMGSVQEIADSFNESLSEEEQKKYKRSKVINIVVPVAVLVALIILYICFVIPKGVNITDSEYFTQEQVEAAMKNTVALLDAGDYAALQENCSEEMKSVMTAETMEDVKKQMAEDWGSQQSVGITYMSELEQEGRHYVVCEMTVGYENISVTYRLTYDEDMKLTGIYIR